MTEVAARHSWGILVCVVMAAIGGCAADERSEPVAVDARVESVGELDGETVHADGGIDPDASDVDPNVTDASAAPPLSRPYPSSGPARDCVRTESVWTREQFEPGQCWTGDGTVPINVCWESDDPIFAADRETVRLAVQDSWERESRVRFQGWGTCSETSSGIRIHTGDVHPASAVGVELDGKRNGMHLSFTFNVQGFSDCLVSEEERVKCVRLIAIHEFGHALGFRHEQRRENTPDRCKGEEDFRQGGCTSRFDWDGSSVMNYCAEQWNGGGHLSAADIGAVRCYYGEPTSQVACEPPRQLCDGKCVDTETDELHCGGCTGPNRDGRACTDFMVCRRGSCECPTGMQWCSGAGCVDTYVSAGHCGGCGLPCPAGHSCSDGKCRPSCAANEGQPCNCGGRYQCDGTCSSPLPEWYGRACGCDGRMNCAGECTAPFAPNHGAPCGCGGVVQCPNEFQKTCTNPFPSGYGQDFTEDVDVEFQYWPISRDKDRFDIAPREGFVFVSCTATRDPHGGGGFCLLDPVVGGETSCHGSVHNGGFFGTDGGRCTVHLTQRRICGPITGERAHLVWN